MICHKIRKYIYCYLILHIAKIERLIKCMYISFFQKARGKQIIITSTQENKIKEN